MSNKDRQSTTIYGNLADGETAAHYVTDVASGRQDFDPWLGFIVEGSTKLDELAYVFFVALHCREWTTA